MKYKGLFSVAKREKKNLCCTWAGGAAGFEGALSSSALEQTGSPCPAQIQVQHPAAKSMIEISRTQDEEVGDGTTSVIILGEEGQADTLVTKG